MKESRTTWLIAGVLLGMVVAYYCPAEPAYAGTASSGDKFSMCTVPVSPGSGLGGQSEAVFILDNVTGRLLGAIYTTQAGKFSQFLSRNLAQDFKVTDNAQYVMVSGIANIKAGAGVTPASGALYVGELNSGIVAMYGFPFDRSGRPFTGALIPVDTFNWRGSVN